MSTWGKSNYEFERMEPKAKIRYVRQFEVFLLILGVIMMIIASQQKNWPPDFTAPAMVGVIILVAVILLVFEIKIRTIQKDMQYAPMTTAPSQAQTGPGGPNTPIFCGNCGQPIVKGTSFCSKCGKKLF